MPVTSDSIITELRERFPKGSFARGVVSLHVSFGFFVDIGVPEADGLVRVIDITDEPRAITEADYPPIGSEVRAYVWGVEKGGGTRPQVILSIKPSLMRGAA